MCIVGGGLRSKSILPLLNEVKSTIPDVPEALGLLSLKSVGKEILSACRYDTRGFVYALLELADRLTTE